MREGHCKTLLGQGIWSSMLTLGSLVWLGPGVLLCGFPDQAQSQQPALVQTSETGTAVDPQLPDLQLPGSISGTVVDGTGAVVAAARVTLAHADQSTPQEVLSGDDGQFSFVGVFPGTFQITIIAAGFAGQTFSGILHTGEAYHAPPSVLALASVSTELQVTLPPAEVAEEQIKVQEKQRILGVVPNFYVSYAANAVPLTAGQKFKLAWRSMTDPVTVALAGVTAGAQQAQNDLSGYGRGAAGYAKRFGASYADTATSALFGSAVLPSLLRQDPRYFYKGSGSAGSRVLYAAANAVICKGDNQRWQPNYSALLGGLASGGISNLYYPAKERGAALVFENTAIGTGTTVLFNLFQEFFVRKLTPHVANPGPARP